MNYASTSQLPPEPTVPTNEVHDREPPTEDLTPELLKLQELLDHSRETLRAYELTTTTIEQQLNQALSTAERVRHQARVEADEMVQTARAEREQLNDEVEQLRRECQRFGIDLAQLVERGMSWRESFKSESEGIEQRGHELLAQLQVLANPEALQVSPPVLDQPVDVPSAPAPELETAARAPEPEPVEEAREIIPLPDGHLAETSYWRAVQLLRRSGAGKNSRLIASALGRLAVLLGTVMRMVALAWVVSLTVLVAPRALGWQVYIAESVDPYIPPGSLVVAQPMLAKAVGIGSVVAREAEGQAPEVITMSMVTAAEIQDGRVTLRGQAGTVQMAVDRTVWTVVYTLPWAGTLLRYLTATETVTVIWAFAALLLVSSMFGRRRIHFGMGRVATVR